MQSEPSPVFRPGFHRTHLQAFYKSAVTCSTSSLSRELPLESLEISCNKINRFWVDNRWCTTRILIWTVVYLDLGAVVRVLCRQQAREALGLLRHRLLALLLTRPVAVHVMRFQESPSPPPMAVKLHVHYCVLGFCLPLHIWVGDPWGDTKKVLSNTKKPSVCNNQLNGVTSWCYIYRRSPKLCAVYNKQVVHVE